MTKASNLLDEAMEQRRVELGMSWKDVAAEAGVSVETLTALRKGRTNPDNANPLTKRGVERALLWEAGGFDDALAGRTPKPQGSRPGHKDTSQSPSSGIDPWSLTEAEFRALPAEQQMAVMAQMMKVAQESRGATGIDSRGRRTG